MKHYGDCNDCSMPMHLHLHDSVYPCAMTLIRFDAVTLDLADQNILSEANLTIESGERVCLIGRNGAGKSTTFKLISGEMSEDLSLIHI